MLKVTFAVLSVVLAASASAAGWRGLRVDGSSEDTFKASVAVFQDKLSAPRRHAFERALQDIWFQGVEQASAKQREYTEADYLAQLDGLAYEQVVELLDPTGSAAKEYRAEYYRAQHNRMRQGGSGSPTSPWAYMSNDSNRTPVYGTAYRGLPQTANGY